MPEPVSDISIHIDLFHFDFEAMTFYVEDSKVELSKTEQKLLRLLVENRGRTMVTEPAYTACWQKDSKLSAPKNSNLKTVMDFSFFDKINTAKNASTEAGLG